MSSVRIGIVGFGEAGSAIAAGLTESGTAVVTAYDTRASDHRIVELAASSNVLLSGSLGELADRSDVILCLTSASSALSVAREIAPHLSRDQAYSDWNSAGPQTKLAVAQVIQSASGAHFCDGAVMDGVPQHRHAVPVLLSGPGAQRLRTMTEGTGMRLEVIGSEPGQASAVKMFRSLLVKGLEALLLECLLGASRYDADALVLSSMNGSLPSDWSRLASYLVGRTFVHGKRRAAEMREVAATLAGAGIEPVVANACAERLEWFVHLGLAHDRLAGPPQTYQEVLEMIGGE